MARTKSNTSVKSIVEKLEVGDSYEFVNKGYVSVSSMISQLKRDLPQNKEKRFKVKSVHQEVEGFASWYNTIVTRVQ